MPDVDQPRPDMSDGSLGDFCLDVGGDSFIDRIRQAEQSDVLGTIGKYELLEEVGRGGQGIVYRAVQPGTGRVIAVKRMLAGSFASEAARQRFEREVETASSVNHPGIVTVYGIEHIDGQPLLSMEWVDGIPINRWSRPGDGHPPMPRDIVACMVEVCDAVAHAHRHGIIHRDLKPSNILVDTNGRPHVLDFGLAKLIDGDTSQAAVTLTEQFVGTPAYAAPEQIRANEKTSDVRTDVYALGVVLYEMLTGRLPYDTGGNLPDAFRAIEHAEPKRPSLVSSPFEHELELIVLKALRKAKRERYQSVDGFRDDLQRFLDGEPVVAHPPTTIYQMRKLVRRHRLPFAFASVLAVLIFGSVVVVSVQAARIATERDKAVAARSQEAEARQAAERDRNRIEGLKARAEHESAKAQAISDFLQEMLSSVKPDEEGHDVRVSDVLAQASKALSDSAGDDTADGSTGDGDKFDGDWETAAALHLTLSDTYRALGLFGDAERELEAAIDIQVRELGLNDLITMKSRHSLATLYTRQSRYDEAETLLNLVIAETRAQLGDDHEQVGIALGALVEMYVGRSDYDAALAINEEALDILSAPGVDEGDLLASLYNRSSILTEIGRFAEAETILIDVLARQIARHGEDHLLVMTTKGSLALVVAKGLGRPEDAVGLYREVVAHARRTQGPQHPETASMVTSLAACLQAMGEYEEAEPLYRESVDIYRVVYDEPHPDLGIALNNLAYYLGVMNRLDEADPVYRETVDVMRKSLGEDHVYTSIVMHNYGRMLQKLNRLEGVDRLVEAEELIRGALAIREARLPPDHEYIGDSLSVLGKLLMRRTAFEEAEPALRRCAEIRAVALPEGHWRIPDSRSFLGGCLTQLGRYEEAEPLLLEAHEELKSARGATDYGRTGALERIIALYEAWGREEQAQEWIALRSPDGAPAGTP